MASGLPDLRRVIELARAGLLAPEVGMAILMIREFQDDAEAHDDALQSSRVQEFDQAFAEAAKILVGEFGQPCDLEADMPPCGVWRSAFWETPHGTLYLAAAHEDRELPMLLVVGAVEAGLEGRDASDSFIDSPPPSPASEATGDAMVREIPGTVSEEGREVFYIEILPSEDFHKITDAAFDGPTGAPPPTHGGVLEERVQIKLDGGRSLLAISCRGDLDGFRAMFVRYCRATDRLWGIASDGKLTLSDGSEFNLCDCDVIFEP